MTDNFSSQLFILGLQTAFGLGSGDGVTLPTPPVFIPEEEFFEARTGLAIEAVVPTIGSIKIQQVEESLRRLVGESPFKNLPIIFISMEDRELPITSASLKVSMEPRASPRITGSIEKEEEQDPKKSFAMEPVKKAPKITGKIRTAAEKAPTISTKKVVRRQAPKVTGKKKKS